MNITASVLYTCSFLPALQQFPLSAAMALAVRATVADFIPEHQVFIKWPNDIYIGEKKIAGILIENALKGNHIHYSIIGVGLNVLQEDFSMLPQAGSMKQHGYSGTKEKVLGRLMERLEQAYFRLKKGQFEGVKADYESHLLGKGKLRNFEVAGVSFKGRVSGITAEGLLNIDTDGGIRTFRHQEITWQFE